MFVFKKHPFGVWLGDFELAIHQNNRDEIGNIKTQLFYFLAVFFNDVFKSKTLVGFRIILAPYNINPSDFLVMIGVNTIASLHFH